MIGGIRVLITPGLGNQMFQYALGRSLSIRTGQPLVLDTSALRESDRWTFDLRHFRLSEYHLRSMPWNVFWTGLKICRRLRAHGLLRSRLWVEPTLEFTRETLEIQRPCVLDGFFQSELYFSDIADRLREDFTIVAEQDARSTECERRIRKANSIALHVRRGDYITDPVCSLFHGTCPKKYYDDALDLVLSRIGRDAELFVFSDDMEWCREIIRYPLPTTYVDWNADRSFEDMRLMRACTAQIIANSTFSWWAAWLNPRPGKVVVAPRRWYLQPEVPCDLPKAPWLTAI